MTIEYAVNEPITAVELAELFRASGINRSVHHLDRIQRMIDHADEFLSARDNGHLIGVLRAITDYSYCCHISEVAVHRDYQRLGIGTKLLDLLIGKLGNEEIKYMLTSSAKAFDFYKEYGFEQAENAFVIKRQAN